MIKLYNHLKAFIELVFPRVCLVCGDSLFACEVEMCHRCLQGLPMTGFECLADNPVEQLFWGKVKLDGATSMYYYRKEEKVQRLIHEVKYHGNQYLGYELGRQFGGVLKKASGFNSSTVIVPVPLHFRKIRLRGFNQSEVIARGMAKTTGMEVNTTCLVRNVHTATQTKKNKFERWQNVEGIFSVTDETVLVNQHVLLVDDVVTTGSTLESCVVAIQKAQPATVRVATLACAYI